MKNEELQAHITALEAAFASGKVQGCVAGGEWVDLGSGSSGINFAIDYRIKPQPREVWIEDSDLAHLANGDKMTCLRAGNNPASKSGYTKFREVIE